MWDKMLHRFLVATLNKTKKMVKINLNVFFRPEYTKILFSNAVSKMIKISYFLIFEIQTVFFSNNTSDFDYHISSGQ